MVEEEIENNAPQVGDELDTVEAREREIKQSINNLVENLTSTNKEYVDARLIELKREMAVLESKRLELETTGAKKIEFERIVDQAVELAEEFKTAFGEGSIEEKRLFLRAFLEKIELNPLTGRGQAVMILLQGMGKLDCQIKEELLLL